MTWNWGQERRIGTITFTYKLKPCWHANNKQCIRPEISWICWSVSFSGWRAFKSVCVRHCASRSLEGTWLCLRLHAGHESHAYSTRVAVGASTCFVVTFSHFLASRKIYVYIYMHNKTRYGTVYDGMRWYRHCADERPNTWCVCGLNQGSSYIKLLAMLPCQSATLDRLEPRLASANSLQRLSHLHEMRRSQRSITFNSSACDLRICESHLVWQCNFHLYDLMHLDAGS